MGSSSSTLPIANRAAIKHRPLLSLQQKIHLGRDVTNQLISSALHSIEGEKVPDIDGYNADFFQKTWHILKDEILQAIKEFFRTAKLYRVVNCIAIIVIPKTTNLCNVKEFGQIACCTILYKVSGKVFTARLQPIMASLICKTQEGFIIERKIVDNIIMAHQLMRAYTRKHISSKKVEEKEEEESTQNKSYESLDSLIDYLSAHTLIITKGCFFTISQEDPPNFD